MIQVFGTKKCASTRKAERFFKERRIRFHVVDLAQRGMSPGELRSVAAQVGGMEALLDREGPRYRDKGLKFAAPTDLSACYAGGLVAVRYVDNHGRPACRYPANPNGSPEGVAGFTSADGRVTVFMPHPERVHLTAQRSWHPEGWGDEGWMAACSRSQSPAQATVSGTNGHRSSGPSMWPSSSRSGIQAPQATSSGWCRTGPSYRVSNTNAT